MNKYLLNEILCGDNKLIIPDLQRDYCWAEHHLVEPFISGLMDQYLNPSSREKKLNMGLLYWYKGLPDYYWQLCDGQQRITTLFLCLGILNRKCEGDPFSDLLISPFELKDDDKEPRLQYAIRESSLYFLSDLVCRFFLDKSVASAGDIPSQPWYFNDYRFDPSIRNYLTALQEIEKLVADIDAKGFGDYLSTQLEFYCHDMGSRKEGEETFVIINTTGEPLTPTENLKPHIIRENAGEPDIAQRWEAVDHFFWKHRGKNETSDAGLNAFLRIVSLLHAYEKGDKPLFFSILKDESPSFDYKQIRFPEIEACLEAYSRFREVRPLCKSDAATRGLQDTDSFSLGDLFTILPALSFIRHRPNAQMQDIKRVHHLLANIVRYQDISSKESDLTPWQGLDLIAGLGGNSVDVVDLLGGQPLEQALEKAQAVFPDEEKIKLHVLRNADPKKRERLEEAFAKAEDYWLFDGEIKALVTCSLRGDDFDEDKFETLYRNTRLLWDSGAGSELRCALFTLNLPAFPLKYSGPTKSMGYNRSNWKKLFKENSSSPALLSFIENVPPQGDALSYLNKVRDAFTDQEATVYPLVKEARYIAYCQEHFIVIGDHIILLNPKIRAGGWIYLFDGHEVPCPEHDKFKRCYLWAQNILYTDHETFDISIDLVYQGPGDYRIEVYEKDNGRPKYVGLSDEVTHLGFSGRGSRYTFCSPSIEEILQKYFRVRQLAGL